MKAKDLRLRAIQDAKKQLRGTPVLTGRVQEAVSGEWADQQVQRWARGVRGHN